ncbi:MAG: ComEC/Rec2 family competence protein [Bacteroidaceae bacterium]|nr:ComEC/Rec2 family competence protein [Bacteroidaceae bacterium]
MIIRQPLIWATLLYIIGIMLGNPLPGIYFLCASVALLTAGMLLRKKTYAADALLFLFWITLGMARIGMEKEMPPENPLYNTVCEKAQEQQQLLTERLHKAGLGDEALSLSSALLLGNKTELDKETRRSYAQAGVSHLLALSGMHLGIIYGLLYIFFVRRIRFSEWKWFWLPPILLTIWGYAFVAGMPISLVRATIMFSFATIATLAQNDTPPLHILALSALAILLFSPSALFGIGFQLSFLAVFFIIALYQPLKRALGLQNIIAEMLLLSVVAQLGTAPLSIFYFHTLPLAGALVSTILIPLTTVIIYLGLMVLLAPVGCLTWLLNTAITLQNGIVKTAAGIPYATITDLYPSWWQVCLVYMLLLCIIARSHIKWGREDFNL